MRTIVTFFSLIRLSSLALFRVAIIVVVFACALYGFAFGAGTENIENVKDAGLVGWIYYTISLFVLGGIDVGAPMKGGAPGSYLALWIAYYLAPLITTTVLLDAISNIIKSREIPKAEFDDHIIVIGTWNVAAAYLDAIREVDAVRQILIIEHSTTLADSVFRKDRDQTNIVNVAGNVLRTEFLQTLSLDTAFRVVVICEDDLLNLECSWSIRALSPELPIACHVGDLPLLRPVSRIARNRRSDETVRLPSIFSTHRIASLLLYEEFLEPHFAGTANLDKIVIAGFGQFGQTVLELITSRGAGEVGKITIVANDANRHISQLTTDIDLKDFNIETIEGDLENLSTWQQLAASIVGESPSMVLLAASDLACNFRAASILRTQFPETRVLLRCFRHTAFSAMMAEELNVEVLCLEVMLHDALVDHFDAFTMA